MVALCATPFLLHNRTVPAAEFSLALGASALFVSATVVPLAVLRAQERLRDYLLLTGVIAVTTAALTVGVVVGLGAGVTGWFLATSVANVLTLIVAVRLIPLRRSRGFNREILVPALLLGFPLVPHLLSHWALGVSNRIILAGVVSTAEVGVYALAANIALPVAIVLLGWRRDSCRCSLGLHTEEAVLAGLSTVIVVQFLLVMTITTTAALLGPVAVHYLAPPDYYAAAALVPWIVLAYGLFGLYFLPMNAVTLTAGRTAKVWMVTASAAGVNVLCLFLFVDAVGLIGAGVA